MRLHTGQDYAGWVLRAVKRPEAKFEKVNTIATLNLPALGEERPVAPTASAPPGEGQRINSTPAAVAQVAASPVNLPERHRRD